MYLFTSAIFFLLFFALKGNELQIRETPLKKADRKEAIEDLKKELQQKPGDSSILNQLSLLEDSTKDVYAYQLDTSGGIKFSMGNSRQYRSVEHYDSVQNTLPKEKKDGWISKAFTRRGLELKEKYSNDMRQGLKLMWGDFLHKLPYMLFLSLPFFAFILKLLYIRRKNFFYSDHAVFTLYHYIFSFILLMAMLALGQLQDWTGFSWMQWLVITLLFAWGIYLLIEMKFFYRQRWIKTIFKFLLMNVLGFVVIIILFIVFLLISLFT